MEGLSPEAARAARDAEAAVEIGLREARDAVASLRSPAPGSAGFGNVIRRVVEDYGDRFGLRVVFTLDEQGTPHIAARTQAEVLRIVQEALTNAARHANATVVGVRLVIREDRIGLRVVDNGRGFDRNAIGDTGYGLTSMQERASLIGGRLRVASRPGAGTRVMLMAPLVSTPTAPALTSR
jgi:two-component system sensor histidine kinase DegS